MLTAVAANSQGSVRSATAVGPRVDVSFIATKPAATGATINKPSIQITLRTHQQYYRNGQEDQETWSWTPRIVYRVNGPIPAGSQLAAEFTLPSGKPWIKLDCNTQETGAGSW